MVGVAGRSKGCKTCRDRKIKCDETRPGCIRCQKIGKDCPGYSRPIHFVYTSQQKGSPITWEETPTTTIESCQLQLVVANGAPRKGKNSKDRQGEVIRSDTCVSSSTPNIMQNMPFNISIPINKSEVYVNVYVQDFIHVSAPYRSVFKTAMVPYRFGHIYATHFRNDDSPETRKELEDAYASCATTYFALKERDVNSKIQGHILYLKLLRQLKNYVKNGLANSDPAVFLYTCMMAAHYEILTSSSALTWLYHLAALGRLILSLGPYAFHDPLAGAILEVVRPYILMNGMLEKKRSFLEHEDWISIPAQYYPGGKSCWNRLIDIACPFPRLVEEGYALSQNITREAGSLHVQSCIDVAHKLLAWRREWNETYGQEPYTYTIPSTSIPYLSAIDEQGPLFETILFFENVSISTTVYQYNVYILVLISHLSKFIPWFELYFGKYDPLTEKLKQAIGSFEVELVCREIARSVDYQRAPEFKFGSTGMYFGVKVAYDFIGPNSRLGRFFEKSVIDSPLMRRTGGVAADDLLKPWYGPDPPTEEQIFMIQEERLRRATLVTEVEEQPQQQPMMDLGYVLGDFVV
ncbi:hypothetical protein TWF569_009101 [Orbilia oligospora]|uniref:Zn(2)-C6 fungal-type domain-containing protein n=2 Tax=Orbilia oligospora TaxID=2813651 RepID=A0A7C8J9T1_ORBOL|nr:hypothetical protein TWF102_009809 [Orbilia oligospora]KAF3102574.1 hypothetical protein TWF706_005217 [Orbilia oligospora]KAF3110068.1 hypothetical protein TWF103_004890 [Orbilia oligospora]KAF3138018.1 hypothetical protein TWF569_009101 [Orbilia oligospora]KAF3153233.1 hypothetical protein TWF594_000262 [Orbilia oligospora]